MRRTRICRDDNGLAGVLIRDLSPQYPRKKKGSIYINIRNPIPQKVEIASLQSEQMV